MDTVLYNIPVGLIPKYRGRSVVVRFSDPAELVAQVSPDDLANVRYLQLITPDLDPGAIEPLARWGREVPLDIVIADPVREFPLLYNFGKLIDTRPIRASIAVKPGFIKAVRLALALNFAVRLQAGQPDAETVDEMSEVLDLYLHRATVTQPVEFFHSAFLAAYRQEPASLWMIQEDDPEHFRFVTDDGVERYSSRFGEIDPVAAGAETASSQGRTGCEQCEFLTPCGGYFKWPDRSYNCDGVIKIFRTIDAAATELRTNVADFVGLQEGAPL